MRRFILLVSLTLVIFSGCAGGKAREFYGMARPGGLEGVLTDEEGRPVSGAEVYIYTDPDRKFRGPAEFMAEPTGEDGRYFIELPSGVYYAVARKRSSGSISGNLQKGDYYSREAYGPVEVRAGACKRADLKLVALTGNMLFNVFAGRGGLQGIRGVIRCRDGSPMERAYAFAYKDPRMAGKPDYVSEWTRADGAYVVYVQEPGVYYVGARTGFMGVPRPDEPYGRYEGGKGHAVTIGTGEFAENVDITLKRFSDTR